MRRIIIRHDNDMIQENLYYRRLHRKTHKFSYILNTFSQNY